MPKIAIAVLDINSMHINIAAFAALTAKEKMDRIEKAIAHICEVFSKAHKESMWVITWREYGISDAGSKFSEPQVQTELQQRLLSLTAKYPQLTVIAGTVGVKQHFGPTEYKDELEKVKNDWRKFIVYAQGGNLSSAVLQDDQLISYCDKIFAVEKTADVQGIDVVRNVCYVVQKNKVIERGKTIPSFDLDDDMHSAVFSPGDPSPLISLTHPVTAEAMTVGVEVCREHSYSLLQDAKRSAKPALQFLLSHSVHAYPQNICGSYFVHADGVYHPEIFFSDDKALTGDIVMYQLNALANMEKKSEAERNQFVLNEVKPKYLLHHVLAYEVPQTLKEDLLEDMQESDAAKKQLRLKQITDSIQLEYRRFALKLANELKQTLNEKRAEDGKAALHLAAEKNYLDVAEALLANGANPMQSDAKEVAPALVAVSLKHWDMAARLLFYSQESDKKKLDAFVAKFDLKNLIYIVPKFNLWIRFMEPESRQLEMLRRLQDENNVLGYLLNRTCYLPVAPDKPMRWIERVKNEFEDLEEAFVPVVVQPKVK